MADAPTPRTDALVTHDIRTGQSLGESQIYDLARQLERELAAAQGRVREAEKSRDAAQDEYDYWRQKSEAAQPDIDAAIDRAERAESALASEREARERAERDAKRYRWITRGDCGCPFAETDSAWDSKESLDVAIDSAIAQAEK